MKPYVIRQGDYLLKLATVHGFDVDEIWSHPKNESLRRLRGDHHILAPGDILFLPDKPKEWQPITKGTVNRYVARVPKVPVKLHLQGLDGSTAGAKFVVRGGATPSEGTVDDDGMIDLMVPVHVAEIRVELPEHRIAYSVRVGHMDPITERSGVAARLAHLGYLPHPGSEKVHARVPGWEDAETRLRHAVQIFQRAQGLPPTGDVDDATREALVKAHGS